MKNILLLLWVFMSFFIYNNAYAQTVSYTYRALAAEGCSVKYSVAKQDNAYFIIATVSSDRMIFLKESTMMVRTANGEVLKFNGELLDNGAISTGIVSGNMVIPVSSIISTAQFRVSPEQFELLKDGIVKVRLSTTPIEHEREFKKDKIGKKLYEFFTIHRDKVDNF